MKCIIDINKTARQIQSDNVWFTNEELINVQLQIIINLINPLGKKDTDNITWITNEICEVTII